MRTFDPLLEPFRLKGLTLRNRVVSTSHEPAYAEDGMPKDRYRLYHLEKARGGVGLTMIAGSAVVAPDSPPSFGNLLLYKDEVVPWLRRLADDVHEAGAAVAHLRSILAPGLTENEVWGAFTGHAFAHGGEYAECRLLSSVPRTNPWFQEATDRRIEPGDLVCFDTDLIGPCGYLADLSRAYLAGDVAPTREQRWLYYDAEAFLDEIIGALRSGAAFDELGERLGRRLPERYHPLRYAFIAHSTGLCDEYPTIVFEHHHQGEVCSGMVFSVEAYVVVHTRDGAEGGAEGIKLEEQVLVTDTRTEVLSHAPHDERLSSR